MRPALSFLSFLLCAAGVSAVPGLTLHRRDIDSFVAGERPIALQGALNNIGPNGSLVPGAGAGYVVASPSLLNPDYFYTWSRDSALTLKMLVDEFIFGNSSLQSYIEDYLTAQAVLQTVTNPSGSLLPEGLGLGEPKFNVDGTRYNGAWGRPQRDGPALRAITLMTYSNWLISQGQWSRARTVVWPVIQNDLSYVGQYWNQTGFDLWEETDGSSYFTLQNQHRALSQGSALAKALNVTCTGCDQASEILCFLQSSFWNGEYFIANINVDNDRTGIDANTILSAISMFDIEAACDDPTFQPCHSKSLANFKVFVDAFRQLYPINSGIANNSGVSVGRYPEDVYYGGNPWYLIVTGAAEFLYDAVAQWNAQQSITVDDTSLPFFRQLYPSVQSNKTYTPASSNSSFAAISNAATKYADSFVSVFEQYMPANGTISEQYDNSTGAPTSAYDLTWSFAAFVTMSQRRSGQYPASWGASKVIAPNSTCAATSTEGVYSPAVAAGAPNITTGCTVAVTFNVNASTYYGENLYLTGNVTELGAWDPANAEGMSASGYTSSRPLWDVTIYMTPNETVSYVYLREEDCDQADIYETTNRTLVVPACGSDPISTNDAWVGPVGSSGGC